MEITELIGKVILKIEQTPDKDRLTFYCADGRQYAMYHNQDCCESVEIDDIVGNLQDLIRWPILAAEETTKSKDTGAESFTYTFYHIRTIIGTVTIKWLGTSNGYYSEEVDFVEIKGRDLENIQDIDHEVIN